MFVTMNENSYPVRVINKHDSASHNRGDFAQVREKFSEAGRRGGSSFRKRIGI